MGLWIVFPGGSKQWLSEPDTDALCDVLWASVEKGAVSAVAKITQERRRPPALHHPVSLTDVERDAFNTALNQARHPNVGR